MRFISYGHDNATGIALKTGDGIYRGLAQTDHGFPGKLGHLLRAGPEALTTAAHLLAKSGKLIDPTRCTLLPPITAPGKIIRVCPSYPDESREANCERPACASLSTCSRTSLIGHDTPLRQPGEAHFLGYEGELVAVMGRTGKCVSDEAALSYVAGYTIFSSPAFCGKRDSTPHWKANQHFDGDGAMGPEFVTSDEVPNGATALRIRTRMNDMTLQDVSTSQMAFDVATAVSLVSHAMTLEPGDLIVLGRAFRFSMLRMPTRAPEPGDVCEVEIEQIGVLRNVIGTHLPNLT
jgi:acylpyruvate hydrolase